MNRGLIIKSVREVWLSTVLFGLAMAGFEALLVYILPTVFTTSAGQMLQLDFFQGILKGLLGADAGGVIGPETLTSLAWVHPVVLILLWTHAITFWTRLPAGEIDRGTIDVLLSLPVSRWQVYVCESVVWLPSGIFVVGMGLAGHWIGGWLIAPEYRTAPRALVIVVANLFCLYLSVGGVSCLVSALSNRRGRAVGVVFAIVLSSFLLNFLSQYWEPARSVSFLSVLHYYRPMVILRDLSIPMTDMLVLAGVGAGCWLTGAFVFARRDICTT